MNTVRFPLILLGVLSLGTAGCGGGFGNVSGTVSFQGQTLSTGHVTFLGKNWVLTVPIKSDGTYKFNHVAEGPITILVQSRPQIVFLKGASGREEAVVAGDDPGDPENLKPANQVNVIQIPDRYALPDKSGLTYTVIPGEQEYNISLLAG